VIRCDAPSELLDTYEAERRPHVSHVISAAVDFGRVICDTDHSSAQMRDQKLLSDTRPLDERFAFRLPPLTGGPLVLDGGGRPFPQPVDPDHQHRLDDWIGQRFLVLAVDESALGESVGWWRRQPDVRIVLLADVPEPSAKLKAWFDRTGGKVAVVRPDRYLLGVAECLDEITTRVRSVLGAVDGAA
jgi:hypothetical protein